MPADLSSDLKMHPDEIHTDAELAQRLLAAQFPQWAGLTVRRVKSFGTDNALYRLGDELMVRLPRIGWAVGQVEKELDWLPRLAPHLPLRVPQPLALGQPGGSYPYTWGIYRWLPGEMLSLSEMAARPELAGQLADFVLALRACGQTDAPRADNPATELHELDPYVQAGIEASAELLDATTRAQITAVWDAAMQLPGWTAPLIWVHGDLHSSNLLWDGKRLTAVLDFASLELSDPAVDLMPAWNALGTESRRIYRNELQPDDATWAHGRARALAKALFALPYYQHTNPEIMERSWHTIGEVLAEHQ
ncbi:aminoglycoside phosphotransferase family protein [Deinococcus arenicola]|uniref:Aminoglycoside phosphotransferase family protein n=1 Tax=Deinococcus arenicola TaxID=2994950 RepID=A0ABU4DUL4_9DEIO|nr:aminoglycoside phosphotransferase family protein [Deinococcus sp. ZS9-10]MDV6376135.1 aminoglycoside phosphotransferase family protein [Deinococcus sp. ZS9-10]